jgi:hypothetical protein
MLTQELTTEDFPVLRYDLYQAIFILSVIPNEFRKLLHLPLETIKPPEQVFESDEHLAVLLRSSRFRERTPWHLVLLGDRRMNGIDSCG